MYSFPKLEPACFSMSDSNCGFLIWIQVSQEEVRWYGFPTSSRIFRGVVLGWWRNRTGRPLSPPQIHQKNIWTLSKFHKTTSECWKRTSGTQKSNPTLQKEVGKNIKDKKRDKRGRDGAPSQEGSLKNREVSKHQETFSLPSLCRALEAQRAT